MKSRLSSFSPISILIWVSIPFFACQQAPQISEAEATQQIMDMHRLQRKYHFEKMAEAFADQLSVEHISVNRGEIRSLTRDEHIGRLNNYFGSVEFEKWDDLNPPIIRFSEDYSMAYTIVDKEVVVIFEDEKGEKQRELTKFSWVAIYRRHSDGWKIDCVASTNKPSEFI